MSLDQIKKFKEYDDHESFYVLEEENIGLKAYIIIHRSGPKNISFGATRLWNYSSDEEAIRDALRLSRTMSYKSAFVGLPYGGAKAVIIETPKLLENREKAFKFYAEFVNSLEGRFITGTDAGLQTSDLEVMENNCNYIVGCKVNPEYYTALGLFYAIQTGLEQIYQSPEIKNRTFSVLGLGKVGLSILDFIYPHAKEIYISDIDQNQLAIAKKKFPNLIAMQSNDLIKKKVDVFIPCIVGNVVTKENVDLFQCKAIIGGSNNQLEKESLGQLLFDKNILYAPDFIVNAGGLISVVHEYENNNIKESEIQEKLLHIKESLFSVFQESNLTKTSTVLVAKKIADRFFKL